MDKKQLCQSYFIIFLFLIVIEGHRGLLLILYGSAYIYIINCKANGKKNHHSRILHCEIIYDHSGRNSCARISPTSQSHHFNTFTFKRTNDFAPYPSALEHCLCLGSSQPAYKIPKWQCVTFKALLWPLKSYYYVNRVHAYANAHAWHAHTKRQTERQTETEWSSERMNEQSHVYTENDRIKETLCLYLKSTVHSLVLQSVVWTCRLFCSFSCRHYLIFQIVTWLFAWFHQPLQTSSVKQTEQNTNTNTDDDDKAGIHCQELHLSLLSPKEKQRRLTQQHFTTDHCCCGPTLDHWVTQLSPMSWA